MYKLQLIHPKQNQITRETINYACFKLEEKVTTRFNPFVPNAPFLYPSKTSENRKVF